MKRTHLFGLRIGILVSSVFLLFTSFQKVLAWMLIPTIQAVPNLIVSLIAGRQGRRPRVPRRPAHTRLLDYAAPALIDHTSSRVMLNTTSHGLSPSEALVLLDWLQRHKWELRQMAAGASIEKVEAAKIDYDLC